MKQLNTLFLFCCVFLTTELLAQNPTDEQMKAWQAAMTPGTEHQQMAKGAGEWKAVTKMWMDPAQPPQTMEARAKYEMQMGGRYLVGHWKGEMMGMPFEGMSTTAYDNTAKKYMNSWVDNMSTGMMYMEGKWRDDIKGIEFMGTMVDPMTGKDTKMRQVLMFKDDKTQTMEMYVEDKGKEMKTMEITMTKM
jgi:hypothetical protein